MFVVGQKVVCIDNVPRAAPPWINYIGGMDGLTKGRIYTVREVGLISFIDGYSPCIRVAEIVRPTDDGPYLACRFRPVVERKTDISVFTRMLLEVSNECVDS